MYIGTNLCLLFFSLFSSQMKIIVLSTLNVKKMEAEVNLVCKKSWSAGLPDEVFKEAFLKKPRTQSHD